MERRAPWTIPWWVPVGVFGVALVLLGSAFPNDGALDDATIACGLGMVVAVRARWVLRPAMMRRCRRRARSSSLS